jgi:hypothetical protein
MRSKRRAWPFLARDWVLQKYHWIYDEIYTFEAKKDFWKKKSWTYYEAPVVQIWPISSCFGKSLSILNKYGIMNYMMTQNMTILNKYGIFKNPNRFLPIYIFEVYNYFRKF